MEDSLLVSSRLITNFPLRNSRSEIPASLSGGAYLSVSFVNLSFAPSQAYAVAVDMLPWGGLEGNMGAYNFADRVLDC